MITDVDRRVLKIMGKNLLVTTGELSRMLQKEDLNGNSFSISRLLELGYVEKVESIGTTLVITQKGLRALKEEV